ncbi:MAG: pyridoxamine 5'-phosphate oxidase [Campylobacteraceae bacterium]|nr:pyridoxamine 5'-phosphate oxidase [Campylobacteraceae bacterium]
MDLRDHRQEYAKMSLELEDLDKNPIVQFEKWFEEATASKVPEPNAMTLATVGKNLLPSIRIVLLKLFDQKGFVFFTNYGSSKAKQIEENPQAALHFAWLGVERQIKIEGRIEKISTAESLKYFLSRPKGSQIGAWVSHQSDIISSRSILQNKFNEIKNKFLEGSLPFPSFWGGYVIKPVKIEFWQGGKDRLHDRFEYTLENGKWVINRLAP